MERSEAPTANAAIRNEPRGIGSAGARDPLAREVKLLGALLGQVLVEQGGPELLNLVERVRRSTVALRRHEDAEERLRLAADLDALDAPAMERLGRAFSLYFQLVNLAEEKQRVRVLRRRQRSAPGGVIAESAGAAVRELRRLGADDAELDTLLSRLRINPVLTAHPTEARRRTLLVALRRVYDLLDRLDDPRLTPLEDAQIRRRLREEITGLWLTALVRRRRPSPLDEVRSAMTYFDETLFTTLPRLYRELDAALDPASGARPPRVPAFLRLGSWIGGDRDGNPFVTAEVTREALRIGADHVLRGYERVADRLSQTIALQGPRAEGIAELAEDVIGPAEGPTAQAATAALGPRYPDEPYRRTFAAIAERLRRTRAVLAAGGPPDRLAFASPVELVAEIDAVQRALAGAGAARLAWGAVQEFRWQVETFGFHLASLEVRQHSAVHRAAIDAIRRGAQPPGADVLPTLRAMAELQASFGPDACRRYVISFTERATDVTDVLELVRAAGVEGQLELDLVPLFETLDALERAGQLLGSLLDEPAYAAHLRSRGGCQEVMLGYSDSNKESGFLAAGWALYRAQAALVEAARARDVELTLFHGRGGAIGRGGGPANRAILAQAPGSVDGRLKVTEQGEVIAAHYANPGIALRQLEQLTNAVLLASTLEHQQRAAAAAQRFAPVLDELADLARRTYRALVWEEPSFARWFAAATPIAELSALNLGSRPARRSARVGDAAQGPGDAEPGRGGTDAWAAVPRLEDLRAIPWVFAWSQSRVNLPGWFGLGTAIEGYRRRRGPGALEALCRMYAEWPFFASLLDNAAMILAKADIGVARAYAALSAEAGVPGASRIWSLIEAEHARSVRELLAVTGRERLLDESPVLQRSIELRNPYVDSLSELQVRLLRRLRAVPRVEAAARAELLSLVQLTVSGVAAGLQNTG